MRTNILLTSFLLFVCLYSKAGNRAEPIDKSVFYEIMAGGKLEDINKEIDVVSASTDIYKKGYEGALLMRKAGLLKVPARKLDFFRRGQIKLELALSNDEENAEYHFLRLTIQENAPKIVRYHKQLETDKAVVIKSFHKLSPVVQQAIINYSKSSKVLNQGDFSGK